MTTLDNRPRIACAAALAAPLAIAALLLFIGLGGFGLWEPFETAHLDGRVPAGGGLPSMGDALARAGSGWEGHEELGARLPSAAFALFAAAVLGLAVLALGGHRLALLASITVVGAPVFLFHGRQATGGAPLLLGETLAFAGLALVAFAESRLAIAAGIAAAVVGLAAATWCAGALMGIAVPAGTIFAALAFSGFAGTSTARRRAVLVATAALFVAGAASFALAVGLRWNAPLVTAGLAAKRLASIDCASSVGQLAYGWFPWSALLPILFASWSRTTEEDPRRRALRVIAVAGMALGLVAQVFFTEQHGPSPLFLAVPVSLGAALVLDDLERSEVPHAFAAVVVLAAVAVLVRDFAQDPSTILSGYGLGLKAPEPFKPVARVAIAAAPFLVLVVVAGFVRGGGIGLRGARVRVVSPLAAAAFGGFVALNMVPGLSVHFSPKHVLQTYERFAKGGEPLAVFGASSPIPNAKVLSRADELVDWLSRKDRVFALLPPRDLPRIDREHRAARGDHVFVLDASSSRLLLATSAPAQGEKNVNPIAEHVRSQPFPEPPRNARQVNFEDRVELLGWEVDSAAGADALKRGAEFTLTTYWRCTGELAQSYDLFVHIDGAGPRVNGDHAPVGGAYPTQYWREGDYIRDVYKGTMPSYQKAGRYTIRTGLFHGDTRLKVVGDPSATENSVPLGEIRLD
jgi:hypothetical protein